MDPATVIGWTGSGSLDDLKSSVKSKLPGCKLSAVGRSLIAVGCDPVSASARVAWLPGVRWVAVGYRFHGLDSCLERLGALAANYMRARDTFSVSAEVEGPSEGDFKLAASSRLLESVRGSRVKEGGPRVAFRISASGDSGACGVELRRGPGGVATGARWATCLASGGRHSAVTAWMAATAGYSIRLVHSWVDEASFRQVARLYSELSRRMDARALELVLVRGEGGAGARLKSWLGGTKQPVFCGAHPACSGERAFSVSHAIGGALMPLVLALEDQVVEMLASLRLKDVPSPRLSLEGRPVPRGAMRTSRFGGRESDVSGVMDPLLR